MKNKFFRPLSYILIVGAVAFNTTSCRNENNQVNTETPKVEPAKPVKPKTPEEIQAELKAELKTTMGLNTANKMTRLINAFKSVDDKFDLATAKASIKDPKQLAELENGKLEKGSNEDLRGFPFIVIAKNGSLVVHGAYAPVTAVYEKYTVEKNGDIYTVRAKLDDSAIYVDSSKGLPVKDTPFKAMEPTMDFKMEYNSKTGETLILYGMYALKMSRDIPAVAAVYHFTQDKTITTYKNRLGQGGDYLPAPDLKD